MIRPSPTEARKEIADIIGESIFQARGLKESLAVERKALEQQDPEALLAVVSGKNECAEKLRTLDLKRSRLCEACGFSDGPEQMDRLLDWCDKDDAVSKNWTKLLQLATEGNTLNLTNGAIIRLRQQQFESSISILRGVAPGSDTYGRGGEESGDMSRRSLAEA